jgi:MYXO-CTERM domain-containing protein
LLIIILVVIASGVTFSSFGDSPSHFNRMVGWATILSLLLSVAGTVGVLARQGRPLDTLPRILDEKANALAETVQVSEIRNLQRLVGGDESANVRFTADGISPGQITRMLTGMRGMLRFGDSQGYDLGDLTTVAAYFRALRLPRMVVLGPPGGGKTVLLTAFIVQTLRDRAKHPCAIPVRLDLASYDPFRSDLPAWIAARISVRYGINDVIARRLIDTGRVLPVLDSLDEMDDPAGKPERGIATVSRIGAFAAGQEFGFIVACREREWAQITSESGSFGRATAVHVQDLDSAQIQHYIIGQLRDGPFPDKSWPTIIAKLRENPSGPLMRVLRRPLWLYLAVLVFRADPAALLSASEDTDLRSHMLARFVPAATRPHLPSSARVRPHFEDVDVKRWLQVLACFLRSANADGSEAIDIAPERIWLIAGKTKVVFCQLAIMAVLVYVGILLGKSNWAQFRVGMDQVPATASTGAGHGTDLAFFLGLFILFVFGWRRRRRRVSKVPRAVGLPRLRKVRFRRVSAREAARWSFQVFLLQGGLEKLVVSAYVSLFLGAMSWNGNIVVDVILTLVEIVAVYLGLSAAWFLLVVLGAPFRAITFAAPAARQPYDTLRRNFLTGIVVLLPVLLAITVSELVSPGSISNSAVPGSISVALFVIVITMMVSGASVRYSLAVILMAARGSLPLRLKRFLVWSVDAGILREAGTSYEFRHIELQRWLAAQDHGAA